MCRRFGTLCSLYIVRVDKTTYEDEMDRAFRNFSTQNSDADHPKERTEQANSGFSQFCERA